MAAPSNLHPPLKAPFETHEAEVGLLMGQIQALTDLHPRLRAFLRFAERARDEAISPSGVAVVRLLLEAMREAIRNDEEMDRLVATE